MDFNLDTKDHSKPKWILSFLAIWGIQLLIKWMIYNYQIVESAPSIDIGYIFLSLLTSSLFIMAALSISNKRRIDAINDELEQE